MSQKIKEEMEKEAKNFFQVLQEMPFSKDKIGESFIKQSIRLKKEY